MARDITRSARVKAQLELVALGAMLTCGLIPETTLGACLVGGATLGCLVGALSEART